MKTEFYAEICCDYCNDVIHNHFDCPACKEEYAGTSAYHEIEAGEEIECESCKAKFKLLQRTEDDWGFWDVEQINEN